MAPGSALRSTSLVNIPTALIAELHLLNEALDDAASDIAATLMLLMSEAALTVPSFLGLSVLVTQAPEAPMEITTFEHDPKHQAIGTSLRLRVPHDSRTGVQGPASIELILYAAHPGAFVDLAADLTWLTGRPWRDLRVDEDLVGPRRSTDAGSLTSWSVLNQARGVLISTGLTAHEADLELDARASVTGVDRHHVAAELIAGLPTSGAPSLPPRPSDDA